MRLVFVHGMRQEGKDADKLRKAWEDAMLGAWSKLGLHAPAYELHMPYYGDILEEAVKALRGGGNVLTRGGEAQSMSDTERALINEYRQALGVTDAQIDAEVATELVGRGAGNWGWVQGAARLLEKVPGVGSIVLNLVSQVDGYLDYLADEKVARALHAALSRNLTQLDWSD
jgi:hypothetical protein